MGSAWGRRSRTGLSAAIVARILTIGAGQARWRPPVANGISPPNTCFQCAPPWLLPLLGRRRADPELELLLDGTLGLLLVVGAPVRAAPEPPPPLPLLLLVLLGSAGLRCCGCCFLARGGRLKNWPGSGCRSERRWAGR